MSKKTIQKTSFGFQLFIIGGFFLFFYMFFAFAVSVYDNYKVQNEIDDFQADIDNLAEEHKEKPSYIQYISSDEWVDLYAKQSLNLLNPGEKLILLASKDELVETGEVDLMTEELSPDSIINQPNPVQWREYFFGETMSVQPLPELPAQPIEGVQSES